MEHYWNKKRVGLLLRGDSGCLDLFYSQYMPVLFTWMYYQVGADADIASDLTARVFDRALPELKSFDPHGLTMLQWLREHATAARDEGLLRWQLKPQRPWAWSQLPDKVLNSLAVMRSEPLRNSVAENPFVQEIVQASLAEMEQTDRELMMHRYSHLDTPSNIAAEMNLSIEAVNDLLYKCRHSFRRVFFRLVSSVNPGFAESNAGAGIDVLDSNLEKLLRATGMYQEPSETQALAIRERFEQSVQQIVHSQPAAKPPMYRTVAALAAIVLLIAGVSLSVLLRSNWQADNQAAPVPAAVEPNPAVAVQEQAPAVTPRQTDVNEEELKRVLELGQAGRIDLLREFLKSGQYTSQMAAAHYIGKLGVPSDVALLEAAERQWYANGPAENPFALAIREIVQRYPDELQIADTAPPADEAVVKTAPQADGGILKGYVRDFSGTKAPGAKIELMSNPPFPGGASAAVAQTVTDETGHYLFDKMLDGPYFVKCTSAFEGLHSVRQAVWVKNDAGVKSDFGGPSVITGKVSVNNSSLGGLKLLLSDAQEPAKSGFYAEAVANAEGAFTFAGVRPGFYRLLSLNENQKLVCLESSLEIRPNDFLRIDLDLTPVSVTVEYPEPNAVVSAGLAHVFEPSYEAKAGGLLGDGNFQFNNVVAGSYLLRLELTSGIRLEHVVNIQPGLQNQVIAEEAPVSESVSLTGRLIGTAPDNLLLETIDRRIQIPVKTAGDGSLDLPPLPAEYYHLTGMIHGTRIVFTSLDLTALASPEVEMEIDLAQIMEGLSSIQAVVVSSDGQILSGARISLAGDELTTAESTAQGAFLAAPAGRQRLHVELDGYAPREVQVDLKQPLTAEPSKDSLIVIELGR